MAGTLFIVATPIGNLGDLSPRAAETLRQVPIVVAEDTRQTRKLLHHTASVARLVSLHAHSPPGRVEQCLQHLVEGTDLALCTDAGTPGVSDPGPALVAGARALGITVVPIPGPSAVATALSVTGWPADRYVFMGFPPRKGPGREAWLERIRSSPDPVVCFEAGNRAARLVADVARTCGANRGVMIGREMTKKFEEFQLGSAADLAATLGDGELRGETTIVVSGAAEGPEEDRSGGDRALAATMVRALLRSGVERSRIARVIGEVFELSRNESYRLAMEAAE